MKWKPFSPEYLARDFGPQTSLARDGIRALYRAIVASGHPKVRALFSRWKTLFSEACGYDLDNPPNSIKKLAEFYDLQAKAIKPAEMLFAVQTYYAIFVKLLGSRAAASFHATNFTEGDLFAWHAGARSEPVEKLLRAMAARFDEYDPGALAQDPAGGCDLLKQLYQHLFPKSVRHALGEYYTPDWLAEHVLDELGYVGDPDKRLLDPACGSGTFLVMAINRMRAWYEANRKRVSFDERDLCRKILSNVIGFDLNPLAVMAARTNYLIAIRDFACRAGKVEIPVYLCDAITTPPFTGKVDYIAGNPPWVNWENLPEDYRKSAAGLWQKYDLFRHRGYKAKLGGGKDDISILLTYVAHDRYLSDAGRLGFVITQSVFKSKGGGEGFRTFQYQADGNKCYLRPLAVHDLSDFQPFEGATNRTAVFIAGKSYKPFKYPVPYITWKKCEKGIISQGSSLDDVKSKTTRLVFAAEPVDRAQPTSPWITAPKESLPGIKKVIGPSDYQGKAGSCTWLNGVYWVRILKTLKNGNLLIENLFDAGKIKVEPVQTVIEPHLVYPLLRGRDVSRWKAEPSAHIIVPNRTDKLAGIPEAEMKRECPKTFAYFKKFEGRLRARAGFKQYFKPDDPFYSIYNVGPYTMTSHKVLWREQSSEFQAARISHRAARAVIPDHKLMSVSCSSESEADYLNALMGSSPCKIIVVSYAISTATSTHVLEHVAIPSFEPNNASHRRLAKLSKRCHQAAILEDAKTISALEKEIDEMAAEMWGITQSEMKAIQNAFHYAGLARSQAQKNNRGNGIRKQ